MRRERALLGQGQQCQAVQGLMDVLRSNLHHPELQRGELQSYLPLGARMKLPWGLLNPSNIWNRQFG